MIEAMNFKVYRSGNMLGFFDLKYHGLAVRGCRLMTGPNGYWFSFPQKVYRDRNGEKRYSDFLYLTRPEHERISNLVKLELQAQGFINEQNQQHQQPQKKNFHTRHSSTETGGIPPEHIVREDDDIPF
jgi:hypothetical protein